MEIENSKNANEAGLKTYLSPLGAWALSLGTSIGWGSFVITGTLYLKHAGPQGSIIGLLIGMVVMLLISRNYAYMMESYPDSGGVYTYAKKIFGYDYAFLASWFLALTYLAMFWANATSLPLFARFLVGDVFRFGQLYTLFGYDVFLGEVLFVLAAMLLAGYIVRQREHLAVKTVIVLALVFIVGLAVCFTSAMANRNTILFSFDPAFVSGSSPLSQILYIAFISPWAFIGFENISHSVEEFSFSRKKSFRILTVAVITSTVLYILVILLSISAFPVSFFGSWPAYINNLGMLSGLTGLPVFYAGNYYLGNTGVYLLTASLFALIVTSLFGNLVALSRLFYALAKDEVISKKYADLNDSRNPAKAVSLAVALSLIIPFLGRTAIGWIVDVTTIGAIIVYGVISAAAYKSAVEEGRELERFTGLAGLVIMAAFALMLFFPVLLADEPMEMESYFLFTVWSILGFLYFRNVLQRDVSKNFGKSIIVWIVFLVFVLFTSLNWMRESNHNIAEQSVLTARNYYNHMAEPEVQKLDEEAFLKGTVDIIHSAGIRNASVVIGLFIFALYLFLFNYSIVRKRVEETELELNLAKAVAYKDALTGVKSKQAYADVTKRINLKIDEGAMNDFAILVCDLNGLKYVNDTLGHKVGDDYICAASRMICRFYKHSPVFRTGGDEFVVIMENDDFKDRQIITNAFNRQVEQNISDGRVIVAAGLSEFSPDRDKNVYDVFVRADALMYERKVWLKNHSKM